MLKCVSRNKLKLLWRERIPHFPVLGLDIPGTMFSKPFRVKSNIMLRNSDKRKLRTDLESCYGPTFAKAADSLLPGKSTLTLVTAVLHREDETSIFCVDGEPAFFMSQPENVILPTVYTLWKCPGLAPTWFTGEQVVGKLQGGADLMLPGVITRAGATDAGLGEFPARAPRSVATPSNLASVGVGVTAVASSAIATQIANFSSVRGKGILMKHTVLDHLWLYGSKTAQPHISIDDIAEETQHAGFDTLGSDKPGEADSSAQSMQQTSAATADSEAASGAVVAAADDEEAGSEVSRVEQMDVLLERCFLLALAYRVRKVDLPVLTSQFYRTHMQSCCQGDEHLEIKHSSHKKVSRFLAAMGAKFTGCFTVKETSKGVDSVTDVNWSHPAIRQAKSDFGSLLPSLDEDSPAAEASAPTFSLYLSPSVDLMPVFSASGYAKDSLLTDSDIKEAVTKYVRSNDLVDEAKRTHIHLNDALSKALRKKGEPAPTLLRWDELMRGVKAKMLPRHEIVTSSGIKVMHKGALQPISVSTALRTGNKVVTLIDNVEVYGIEAKDLAERMQHVMASSASVHNKATKGKADRQVLVQGNAVRAVTDMLQDHYNVPQQAITVQQGKSKKSGGKGKK
ncbi:eukaryotic translation initiation factor 2D-like [Sycon ciliatum]|uniref:eukaryotic translation initiation factor 2D-like n=1 Tax=Sycon ciliatum TaxID=27933 RepID=UPI0020AC7309|eukprot:scpid52300/ scgid25225/ Eukaryotic translation initiation factor 2D; Ligatin